MRIVVMGALIIGALATPAIAKDRTGYTAIAAHEFKSAEKTLLAERRIFPDRPELMLNLATVYRQTGRAGEAQALYRAVIARPDVTLDLPNGATASSRDLAAAGLSRTGAPQFSAR